MRLPLLPRLALVLATAGAACGVPDADEDIASWEGAATTRVNVNLATASELGRVTGITPSIATGIVAGRPWFVLADIQRVPGMTATLYAKAKSKLTLGPSCGGSSRTPCPTGQTCARRTVSATSSGVCIPATVTLVPGGQYSVFAHDPGSARVQRVLYGYTNISAGEFARAADKGSIPWYRADGRPGNEAAVVRYVTPTPAGYYTQVNAPVDVPALRPGVLFRVVSQCADSAGGHDCGEGPVAYRAGTVVPAVAWAGNWGMRPYYPGTGRGNPLPDDQALPATGHYPPSVTVEFWSQGLTEAPVSDVGARLELETDLKFEYDPNPPGPGTLRTYPMRLESAGNNWRGALTMPVNFGRAQWNRTFRYHARISFDGGRTWKYAGRGNALGAAASWRTFRVGTPCSDGSTDC